MSGTDADGTTDDLVPYEGADGEPDTDQDEDAEQDGRLAGVTAAVSALGAVGVDAKSKLGTVGVENVSRLGEVGVKGVSRLGEVGMMLVDRERADEDLPPVKAELVDGATVYFIDPAARRKDLNEYDLVLLDSSQYPEPAVLKNDREVEIAAGTTLCAADSIRAIVIGGKRVIVRPCILVEPDRADAVRREHRVELPDAVVGRTIPERDLQSEHFYCAVLQGASQ